MSANYPPGVTSSHPHFYPAEDEPFNGETECDRCGATSAAPTLPENWAEGPTLENPERDSDCPVCDTGQMVPTGYPA